MLQGYTMAIVPCGNPTPKKLPTGGGEWPTFCKARAQRTVRPLCSPNIFCLLQIALHRFQVAQKAKASHMAPQASMMTSFIRTWLQIFL